ncbi:MAG: TonB-dependent receptor [Polyangiaceae bacterium]
MTFATSRAGEATLKVSFHDEIADTSQAGLTREMFAADPERPTLSPFDRMSIRRYEVALTHEIALGESTTLRTLAYAYTTTRLWRNQTYVRSAAPGVQYSRVVGDPRIPGGALFFEDATSISDRTFDVAAIEPRLEQRLVTGPLAHRVVVGARFFGETGERAARRGESRTSYAGALESLETARTYAFAAYLEDEIAVRDYLLVSPGVRYEYATQRRHIERAFVEGAPRDVAIVGDSDVSEVMPGIGLVLGRRHTHAFAGVHVGFAPPRLTSAIGADGIDEQLDAERSVNWEVGARIGPSPWLRVEGTGFLSRFDNQIIPTPGGDAGRLELQNAGETRHSGAEIGARLLVGRALRLPLGIDLSGNYTVSRAVFAAGDYNGNTLPYAPRHIASGVLDVTHALGLGGQVAFSYVGDQFSDEANTVQEDAGGRVGVLPEHVTLDLAARYRHARSGLGATVSVKNLLDDIYVQGRRPDGIFPGGYRQIYFGLRWDWVMEASPDDATAAR